jgi:glycosyltransferase involved in cell wall biosynthesis
LKVLLLSAYDAASHRRWWQVLRKNFPAWDWQILTLPARFFSWRVRGNSLTWALKQRGELVKGYDILIATSMTDLATLRGLVPELCKIPTLLYFHENQFEYPKNRGEHGLLEAQMVSLYSALAADRLAFNSAFNRTSFFQGVEALLARLPDQVPVGIVELLREKSQVLPVPIDIGKKVATAKYEDENNAKRCSANKLSVLWNHRWEYDKGPDRLLAVVKRLAEMPHIFVLNIIGQQFRSQPDEFGKLELLISRTANIQLGHWGFVESVDEYWRILAANDVVLSTATHDFQGLSVLEAVAAGCSPLVPRRLAYLELFEAKYHYNSNLDNICDEAVSAACLLDKLAELKTACITLPVPSVAYLDSSILCGDYKQCFEQTVDGYHQRISVS